MASISETGHAKNVANFEDLISFCTAYDATFNPSKAAIKISNLSTTYTNAKNSISTVTTDLTALNNAINARMIVFSPVKKLTTRAINALMATDATDQTVNDAKVIARKIQGKRATPKQTLSPVAPAGSTVTLSKNISASQQSYDSIIDHFSKLINLLSNESKYTPNETDLKVTALTALLNDMKAKNTAVINATTTVSNSRIYRNDTLYKNNTGLVDIALEVKQYVKSVYGSTSSQFKQVSKLQFTRPR